MEKQAVITGIFLGNGGAVYSRIFVRAESGNYKFDIYELNEAQRLSPGQVII